MRLRPSFLVSLLLPACAFAQDQDLTLGADALKSVRRGASKMASPPAAPIPEPKSPVPPIRFSVVHAPVKVVNNLSGCIPPGRPGRLGCCHPELAVGGVGGAWRQGAEADGMTPLWADSVEIVVTLSQTVFVTFAFPEGGCEFNLVLAHEKGHARDHRALLDSWAKRMEGELERNNRYEPRLGTAMAPVLVPTGELAAYKERVLEKIRSILAHHYAKADDSLLQQWAKSAGFRDTLEEYGRLDREREKACRR